MPGVLDEPLAGVSRIPFLTLMSSPPACVHEPADADLSRIPEAVVQDAWARRLYDPTGLVTTNGQTVTVLDPGTLNRGSGPDFSGATLRIGDGADALLWVGDVEIHRTSREWKDHHHHEDPAYDRVILHVVVSPDRETGHLSRSDGSPLPELVLLPHLDRSLRALAHDFRLRSDETPPYCGTRWHEVPADARLSWIRKLGAARLREQAARYARAYQQTPNLDRLLVGGVFRALGYAPNAGAMQRLAARLPLDLLRQLDDPTDGHALLLGLAGLTDARLFSDDLGERFERLRATHPIPRPMAPASWRHGGRPANAPRVRIAQAAALFAAHDLDTGLLRHDPLGKLRVALERPDAVSALRALFRPLTAGTSPIGLARTDVLLVNVVLPLLLLDAELRDAPGVEPPILAALDAIPAESDRVVQAFTDAGFRAQSALESQGVHQLATRFCEDGHCARCEIGQTLYPALAMPAA